MTKPEQKNPVTSLPVALERKLQVSGLLGIIRLPIDGQTSSKRMTLLTLVEATYRPF